MNIASYISELLYEHECVVIPGFGGFIVNDRPATINRITHQFSPPFRKVMFNIHLSANDGLLINHIANMDHISYVEAKQMVIDFLKHCQEEIKFGNKISFKNIGNIYKNSEGHISFEQNEQVNYNHEAFGLGSFYSPAIERASDEERIKGIVEPLLTSKLPRDRKLSTSRETSLKRRRRAGVVVLILFVLLLSIGGGFTIKENATNYWQNYAMLVPMFNMDQSTYKPERKMYPVRKEIPLISESETSENTFIEQGSEDRYKDITGNHTASEAEITTSNLGETGLKEAAETAMPKDDQQIPDIKLQKRPYLIITGSFSEESNAQKLVNILKQSGVEALIADTTKNGMFRVAYASFTTIDEAKETLYVLRDEAYPDAWILKKK